MATLIKTDGSKLEIQPQNGLDFQLDELQKFVDGYIEIINLHNGDILVINDNGKDVLDSNETATEIAHKHNAILGNVLYNSRYFHYWEKLKFDYNEYFGSMVSTKPIKKHIRRTKTLEWYIKINRDNFTVNPLGVKTYFPPF